MTIEQVKKEIENVNSSTNLSSEERNLTMIILNSYLQSLIQEDKYNEHLQDFVSDSSKLDSGLFQVSDTLQDNKDSLSNIILSSDFIKDLESRGVVNYTLSDLITIYLPEYEVEYKGDTSDIHTSLNMFKNIEEMEKIKSNEMSMISRSLETIFGNQVRNYHESGTVGRDGNAVINQINKSHDELKADYQGIMKKINEMFYNGDLSMKEKIVVSEMVNKLFNYYTNDNKKIDMNIVRQMQEQGKKI